MPLRKKGDLNRLEDYRPISLTSNLGKVLEQVMLGLMQPDLDALLPDHQFGFRTGHSTTDVLCLLKDGVKEGFEYRQVTALCHGI